MSKRSHPTVERQPNGTYRVTIPPHARIDASASLSRGKPVALCTLEDDGEYVLGPVSINLSDLREIERLQIIAGIQNGRVDWIAGISALARMVKDQVERGDVDGTDAAPIRAPTVVTLADVEPEPVQWLWEPYIPLGKMTFLEGTLAWGRHGWP
jgi:hypothetical protein